MKRRSLAELATSIESRVGTAQRQWNPSSPEQCSECCRTLELAAQELEELQAETVKVKPLPFDSVVGRLRRIKVAAHQMELQVDAAAAFCRGMAQVIGRDGAALPAPNTTLYSGCERRA